MTRLNYDGYVLKNFEDDSVVAVLKTADVEHVQFVLSAPVDGDDGGRSEFVWVRLPNGDLILGVFPQAEIYEHLMDEIGV